MRLERVRRRVPVTHWLLIRGRGERPLEPAIDPGGLHVHSSSKRPSVEPGEQAVLYAAVWQAVFAVVEITGDAEHDPTRRRWAWRFPIRALVVVRDLHDAPPVEAAGVFPQSLWRHSHIRLTTQQFEAARASIEAAARRSPAERSGRSAGEVPFPAARRE